MSIRLIPLTDPDCRPSSRRIAWLAAEDDGTPVGSAFLRLDSRPKYSHLGEFELTVHPAERRRGIGSQLLDAVVAGARDNQVRTLLADVNVESVGDHFLEHHGFEIGLTLIYTRLDLSDTVPDVPEVSGYRLISWDGVVPDELVQSFTDARTGMDDAPMGTISAGPDVWDVERTRHAAQVIAQRGDHLSVVAAVDETGQIVGFTEVVVPGDGKGDGQHYGTAVLPAHRGRGLALWMKAAQIHKTRHRFPDLDGLLTDTVDTNAAMRRTNTRLGYRPGYEVNRRKLDV
ncbi:GNAT family N-acetyltransferase [Kribbella pratensis]|uniref:Acetyltransferase (GNAT) family protein n=1 Tax=Kribbella pratensis TaxID=2512112 RepID=A0A4R8CLI9_9ACTN|nr:GNAT family N-acetyltransferase [Kribbella pratensis]TDW76916.1 acetyltransferase (GNAT) family protein [Kribbella pratensis]